MKLYALKTFLVLAKNDCDLSIHKVLGISRSTMWSHISEIESDLGIKLVNRKKQNTSFTEDGMLFIPYAQRIYATFEDSLARMRSKQGKGVPGEIIISTTKAVAEGWLIPGMREFNTQQPQINLRIVAEDFLSRNLENTADVFIRPLESSDALKLYWSISNDHGLYASEEYLAKVGTPKKPDDLLEHRIIAYGEQPFTAFSHINWHLKGKVHGLPKLIPNLCINSTSAIYTAATEGLGICSCPAVSNKIFLGKLKRVLPQLQGPTVTTYFAVRQELGEHKLNNIDLFKNFLEKYVSGVGVSIAYEEI